MAINKIFGLSRFEKNVSLSCNDRNVGGVKKINGQIENNSCEDILFRKTELKFVEFYT